MKGGGGGGGGLSSVSIHLEDSAEADARWREEGKAAPFLPTLVVSVAQRRMD